MSKLQIWTFKIVTKISWIKKKCSITSKLVKSKTKNMHTQLAGTTKLGNTSNQFNLKWCYPQPNNNSLVTPALWLVSFLECHTDLDLVASWKLTSCYIDSLTSQTIDDNKRKDILSNIRYWTFINSLQPSLNKYRKEKKKNVKDYQRPFLNACINYWPLTILFLIFNAHKPHI